MAKFRIVKREKTNGKGDTDTHYEIQKKFLFWFFTYGLRVHYYTHDESNAHLQNMPSRMAMLMRRVYIFNTLKEAKEILSKVENPFVEWYKGDMIIRVFADHVLNDVYINKSYAGSWSNGIGYEYSKNLSELKNMIDKRKIETKVSVVS
jgi:hypothetical protein